MIINYDAVFNGFLKEEYYDGEFYWAYSKRYNQAYLWYDKKKVLVYK